MKEKILRIDKIQEHHLREILHYEQEFLLIDTPKYMSFLHNYVVLNNYVVLTILIDGEMQVRINGVQEYTLKAKGMLYHLPEQLLQVVNLSDDFQAKCIIMSKEFVSKLSVLNSLDMSFHLVRHPFISVSNETLESLLQCFMMLQNLLINDQKNIHLAKILQHLLTAYMLSFSYHIHNDLTNKEPATRNEIITYKFIELLKNYGVKEHGVQFYADKMCLTTKYLTHCVKEVTGISAKQYINKYLIAMAENLLVSNEITLVQVAYKLGFNDPSNFGNFFHKHVGKTPNVFREENSHSTITSY